MHAKHLRVLKGAVMDVIETKEMVARERGFACGWGGCPPSHIERWERVLTSIVAMVIKQPFPCHLHGNLGVHLYFDSPPPSKRGSLREGPANKVSEREGSDSNIFFWVPSHSSGPENKAWDQEAQY